MKSIVAIEVVLCASICALAASLTFTSGDGAFEFQYSSALIDCKRSPHADACSTQGSLCGDENTSTIACLAYPKTEFKKKPTFVAAAFYVGTVNGASNRQACLRASPIWNVVGGQTAATIGSTRLKVFHIEDAWTSHSQDGYVYRTFHRGRCFELGTQMVQANPGAFDPGTIAEFTAEDDARVSAALAQPLHSFKFLK